MKMKKRFLSILLSLVMVLGLMPGMSLMAYAESDALYTFAGDTSGSSFYYNITEINDTNASKIKTIEALVWVTGNPDWGFIQVASGGSIKQYIYDNLNKGIHKYIWNVDSPTQTVPGEGSYAQIQLVQASGNAESGKLLAYRVEFSDSTGTITKGDWGNPICVAPTGLTATYGQTLADVTLNNPAGNTAGTWAWVNSTTSVGNVGNHTFKANFTPTNNQYRTVNNIEIPLTVNTKLMTVNATGYTGYYDNSAHGITVDVTEPNTGYTVKYGIEEGTYNLDSSPTQTAVGTKTVYYQVTADNYTTVTGSATITISDKQTQTITASDVTASYGDTDKSVSASVTDPAQGGGAISYAVKDGSADYIDVNATTGALTIKKVPADGKAYVVVTAAETAAYAQATKDVTVTISKANAVPATVTANNRTYDGTEKPLVNVTGEATGGTMQYALGTDATTVPTEGWSETIPVATEIGTYYVWYKVVGDANHSDTEPTSVIATIAPMEPTITGANLVLDGSLDFRFYVALPVGFNDSSAYMRFTVHGRTVDVPISQARTAADGKRIFSCPVYSIEMAEDVKAEFRYKSGTATLTTSIDKYLNKLSEQSGNLDKLTNLIAATKDYGHYIQPYLARLHSFTVGEGGYAEMPAANSSISTVSAAELETYKTVWNNYNTSVLDSVSYYDTFAESTTLHVQVKLKSAKTVTATVNGESCKVTSLGNNMYGIEIPNIAANNLGKSYNVTFSADGAEFCDIDVSALTYVRAVLASRNETDEAAALTAFYNYFKAADAYGKN